MVRIGELLVAAGVIGFEDCEAALNAQIMYGGRLGTNLVELGLVDLDTVTHALASQHGLPGALSRHFEAADEELQQRLVPDLARRLQCIPLFHVFGRRHGVVIAATSPLGPADLTAIADELLVSPAELIPSIAAEMRIKYHLERVYRIPRVPRFLRVKGSIPPVPRPLPVRPLALPADDDAIVFDDLDRLGLQVSVVGPDRDDRERRRYLEPSPQAEMPSFPRLARGSREMAPLALGPVNEAAFAGALEAIRSASDRERLGERCLEAIDRFVPGCAAAVFLLLRGETAMGWRCVARRPHGADDVIVSLAGGGVIAGAVRQGITTRSSVGEPASCDRTLLHLLGGPGDELIAIPIVIAGRVRSLLACACPAAATETVTALERCAAAVGEAFGRLMHEVVTPRPAHDRRAHDR